MQFLRNILDKAKAPFEKGGKLEKYWPVFDGMDTFMFVPNHTTRSGSHIRDGIDLKRTMITVVLALMPCLLFGIWNTGHQHFLALGQFSSDLCDGFWDKMSFGAIKVLPVVVYRVFTDGRPDELIRGADIVGTPLTCFEKITCTADDFGVFNGINANGCEQA